MTGRSDFGFNPKYFNNSTFGESSEVKSFLISEVEKIVDGLIKVDFVRKYFRVEEGEIEFKRCYQMLILYKEHSLITEFNMVAEDETVEQAKQRISENFIPTVIRSLKERGILA